MKLKCLPQPHAPNSGEHLNPQQYGTDRGHRLKTPASEFKHLQSSGKPKYEKIVNPENPILLHQNSDRAQADYKAPKDFKGTRISSYNFIRNPKLPGTTPQHPPIPVRNPLLRLPCPCSEWLCKLAQSHTKVCFFVAPPESQGADQSALESVQAQNNQKKQVARCLPAAQNSLFYGMWEKGRGRLFSIAWLGDGNAEENVWDDAEKVRVKCHRELLRGKSGLRVKELVVGYASSALAPTTAFLRALAPVHNTTFPCSKDLWKR